jgi:hypothetical protein
LNYLNDAKKLFKFAPATFICAVAALLFAFIPSLIPSDILKTYFFNQNTGLNILIPVLIPFTYQFVRLFPRKFKKRILLTSEGKRSWKPVADEVHAPVSFLTETVSIIAIIFELLIQVGYADPKPEYAHVHIFEVFCTSAVIPFIAWINYYCKVLRDEARPNPIINQ